MSFTPEDQLSELNNIMSGELGFGKIGFVQKVSGNKATLICSVSAINKVNNTIENMENKLDRLLSPSQIGSIIKIKVSKGFVFASINEIEIVGNNISDTNELSILVDYIGHGYSEANSYGNFKFTRGIGNFPVPRQVVYSVVFTEIASVFGQMHSGSISLGTVSPQNITPATVNVDAMLGKHYAILGNTGTGKSSAASLLIRRIVSKMKNSHILIFDPHNEYSAAFEDVCVKFDIDSLRLPYWIMNFEEHVEVLITPSDHVNRQAEIDILNRVLLKARIDSSNGIPIEKITVNTPIPYKLSQIIKLIDIEMGKLDNLETFTSYMRLKNKIENFRKDTRFGFMFSGMRSTDNFDRVIGDLLRFPVNDKPVSIIDLSGIPGNIVNVVVSVIMRIVFDFAVWSKKMEARPVLLVCEEAHRYVPTDKNTIFSSTKKAIDRIAKEGRKYGVSLGLISQRPVDLSETSLSQCGTFFVMRMNNEKDKKFVENILPEGSAAMLDSLSSLDNGEALVVGEGVFAPVKIKFDLLAEGQRPRSLNPHFSSRWLMDINSDGFIHDTIMNWRMKDR